MKKNLNSILTIFLYLVILRHIIAIFTSISQLIMTFSGYLSLPVLLWNLAMHIAMIVVLFNILNIKKWAVYAFGGIQVINVAVLTLFFKSDFFTCSFVAVLLCLLLVVLFCLKKDNVSAWRLFFPKKEEKEDDELACVDEIESFIEEKDVEETFIPELSVNKENEEKEIRKPKTPAIQNDDLFKSLESLPLKEDGSIDYEQMSAIQQFAYTYKTESLEVALKDLNGDIKVMEKSIAKVKKELSSLSGGARAKLRDSLREEQAKLDDLYGLRDKYSVKKKWNFLRFRTLVFSLFFLCILTIVGYYSKVNVLEFKDNYAINNLTSIKWNDKESQKSDESTLSTRDKVYNKLKSLGLKDSKEEFFKYFDNSKSARKDVYLWLREAGLTDSEVEFYEYMKLTDIYLENYPESFYRDDLSNLYNSLKENGYAQDELGDEGLFTQRMCDTNNRKIFYDYVKQRNDFKIGDFKSYEKRIILSLYRRWLYERLSNKYDIGDYQIYFNKMDNEGKRKAVYPVAVEEGLNVGTWEEFNENFGR